MSDSKKELLFKEGDLSNTNSTLTIDVQSNVLSVFDIRTNCNTISLGNFSATQQEFGAVAIGRGAGHGGQDLNAVAIGRVAAQFGRQGKSAIAIGHNAGQMNQKEKAIGIGLSAGANNQASFSVALGAFAAANNQGANSIAIGCFAGFPIQVENTIVLNATGSNLEAKVSNTFIVKPIREVSTNNALNYDTLTGEISYSQRNVLTKVTTEELNNSESSVNKNRVDGLMVFNSTNKTVYISDEGVWYSIKDNTTI